MPIPIGITEYARPYGIDLWTGSLLIRSSIATAKIPTAAASNEDAPGPAPNCGTPCAVVLVLVHVVHPTIGSLNIAKPATEKRCGALNVVRMVPEAMSIL